MLIVRVELLSAITGETRELARMHISNNGVRSAQNPDRGDYCIAVLRGRSTEALNKGHVLHEATVFEFPRKSLHIWNLVHRALTKVGYK